MILETLMFAVGLMGLVIYLMNREIHALKTRLNKHSKRFENVETALFTVAKEISKKGESK